MIRSCGTIGPTARPPRVLRSLGWVWTDHGPMLDVDVDGQRVTVLVPIRRVQMIFEREMAAEGVPLAPAVGAPSVGGLFGRIKRAAKKVSRGVRRAVKRSARGVSRVAKKYGRTAVRKGVKLMRDKRFRAGLAAAAVAVPALAPAAAAVEGANRALDYYESGRRVAERIKQGVERPGDIPKLARAAVTQEAIGYIAQRAQRGDATAARWIGGLEAAKAARRFGRGAPPGIRRIARAPFRRAPVRGFPSRFGPFRGFPPVR